MSGYQRLGLAALVVSAIRAAVADPNIQEQLDEQDAKIGEVRSSFDNLTQRLTDLSDTVAENGTLDQDQASVLDGIRDELQDLALALAGPAHDPADNGVLGEVENVTDEFSPTASTIAEGGSVSGGTGGDAGTGTDGSDNAGSGGVAEAGGETGSGTGEGGGSATGANDGQAGSEGSGTAAEEGTAGG